MLERTPWPHYAEAANRRATYNAHRPPLALRRPLHRHPAAAGGVRLPLRLEPDGRRLRPYRPRIGDRVSREEPLIRGREANLWELPVSFEFDDWPHFQFNFSPYRNGTSAPGKVLEIWTADVDWMDANVDGGVLTVMMHPQVIGRGHRVAMLEQFILHCLGHNGLTFARLEDVALRLPDLRAAA